MEKTNEFVPSTAITRKFLEFLEKMLEIKPPDEDIKTLYNKTFLPQIKNEMRYKELTQFDENVQEIISREIEGLIISYTRNKLKENKNLEGLVLKITEDGSFNKEMLEDLEERLGLYKDNSVLDFYKSIHKELVNYLKENPNYLEDAAKIRITEKDEIELYDFKKFEFGYYLQNADETK